MATSAEWPGDVGLGVGRGGDVRVRAALLRVLLCWSYCWRGGDGEISASTGHMSVNPRKMR